MKSRLILVLIVAVAALLRLHAISDYKFYSDSYQNLIVAHNLETSGSAVGPLGSGGMLYPDFIDWTRPLYPLLISWLDGGVGSAESAARLIALVSSILAIVAAYALAVRLTGSRTTGLMAALLLAISYSHTVWSGFILTEPLAVLIMLVLLERAVYAAKLPKWSVWPVLQIGVLLAAAVLTRYEYILVVPALYALLHLYGRVPLRSLVAVITSATVCVALWFTLFPMPFSVESIFHRFWPLLAVTIFGLIAVITVDFLLQKPNIVGKIRRLVSSQVLNILAVIVICLAIFGVLSIDGLRQFIKYDFVIITTAIIGLVCMFKTKGQKYLVLGLLLAIVLLWMAYVRTNPAMGRYYTHLLPFLIVPAAIGLESIIRAISQRQPAIRYGAACVVGLIIASQAAASFIGLRNNDNGIWRAKGYEEVSATLLEQKIGKNDILLVSLPEPYFYTTGNTTYSLHDQPPFFGLEPLLAMKGEVVIVEDMAMRQLYPNFSALLRQDFSRYEQANYLTGTDYRYAGRIKPEDGAVHIYKMTPDQLFSQLEVHAGRR
jgi:hypothetical protein